MDEQKIDEMAKRIEANRKEAKVKEIKPPKTEKQAKGFKKIPVNGKGKVKKLSPKQVLKKANPKAKRERIKPLGPVTKQFKFKDGPKSFEICDVLNCKSKPKKGFRCDAHRKLIRKAQLKANNAVWKKRVKAGEAGHHAVYTYEGKRIATRAALKDTEKFIPVVKSGHSVVTEVGKFKEIVAKTKALRSGKRKKAA
jgi:hypothetical protein